MVSCGGRQLILDLFLLCCGLLDFALEFLPVAEYQGVVDLCLNLRELLIECSKLCFGIFYFLFEVSGFLLTASRRVRDLVSWISHPAP